MKILFLDAYFEPEMIAYTHLEKDLIEGLTGRGHEIFVVCPTPSRGVSKETRKEYKRKLREDLYGGLVHVRRFKAPKEGRNPIGRLIRYVLCNVKTYFIAKKYKDVDVVFANSTPPTQGRLAGLVKRKLSKKRDVRFVFNLQDIFPDSLVNANMTKEGSLIWKIGRKIENKTYKGADCIVTISQSFKENILAKGVESSKVEVVPNWVDTSDVFSIRKEDNVLFDRYNLSREKFYVCYSGNIGHSQNMQLLLEVAKDIDDENIHFVIVGDGAERENVARIIEQEGLVNVTMLPYQPYDDIASVFSLGDVGLIISKPGIGGSSVPSKTWSIMAAGRPVLASFDEDSELNRLIAEIGCGIAVPAGDKQGLIQAIHELKTSDNSLRIKNGQAYVNDVVNKDRCVKLYMDAIEGK